MQITVTQVSDVKSGQYGMSSKLHAGNEHYFVNEDATALVGKTVEISVEEKTSAKGNKYRIAKIVKVLEGVAPSPVNGKIKWEDFKNAAIAAHQVALALEPDTETVDRSQARVAFVQTILVAVRDNRVEFPDDSDVPF